MGDDSHAPSLQAVQAELQEEVRDLRESPLQAQQAERQFKQQLAALPSLKAKQAEPDNPFGLQHRITDEPGICCVWKLSKVAMCWSRMSQVLHIDGCEA